jgi:tetratricopeptide (TPR) repeat protein
MRFLVGVLFAAALTAQTSSNQAEALWRQHDYFGANDAFRALVEQHPKDANLKVRWGRLLLERFAPVDAAGLFNEALAIDPKNAGAHLGLALIAEEDFEGSAIDEAHKALASDPNLVEARELLAKLALEDSDLKTAREEAAAALKLNAKSMAAEAINASADLLEHRDAGEWLNRIATEHPKDGAGYESIGFFLQLNRRYDDAITYFRKAIAVEPDLWSAHSQLGLNLMRLGRESEAHQELELAFNNHYADLPTKNTLKLMDKYGDFKTFREGQTILLLDKKEADVLRLYIQPEFERALATYQKKYEITLPRPVQLEVYPNHEDFAVRTMGMPGIGILGVTFQDVVAMDSPSGRPPGEFHWASTMWHELSHVYILTITKQRVPRWFTEGVAVHEETQASPDWGDRLTPDVVEAIRNKQLLPVADLDRGFMHPKYKDQVIVSYWQGGRICDFIAKQWGEHKLLDMAHAFANTDSTAEVIQSQLGMSPEEFDKKFRAAVEEEDTNLIANIDKWKKDIRELDQAVAKNEWDQVIAKGPAVRDEYPSYIEGGSAYEALAAAYRKKGDEAHETETLAAYSRATGRNPEALKRLATLLEKQGKTKEAAAVLNRLIYIAPLDEELHTMLGEDDLALGNAPDAAREYTALIVGKAPDQAGAHYGLARALRLEHKDAQAKDEVLLALEAAPNFRPAQKLLLEMTGNPGSE